MCHYVFIFLSFRERERERERLKLSSTYQRHLKEHKTLSVSLSLSLFTWHLTMVKNMQHTFSKAALCSVEHYCHRDDVAVAGLARGAAAAGVVAVVRQLAPPGTVLAASHRLRFT